ncbi:hypothetical protein [Nocardioides sp. MH1]|uniref:hypothetical protein n=1 Tax=Nocardioides sp. MH1 TaxID=3242490 RepID=UPI0035227910
MSRAPLTAVLAASALVASTTYVAASTLGSPGAPTAPPPAAASAAARAPHRAPAPVDLPDPARVPDPHLASGIVVRTTARPTRLDAIPLRAVQAYQRAESVMADAAPHCGLRWTVVAAVGQVVSAHGTAAGSDLDRRGVMLPRYAGRPLRRRDGSRLPDTDAGEHDRDEKHDRPVGPMQLSPATWALIGVDADGNGRRNPYDIDDAALGVAVLLCSGRGHLGTTAGLRAAVRHVNHSPAFVAAVLAATRTYDRALATARPVFTALTLPPPTVLAAGPVVAVAPAARQTRSALDAYPGPSALATDPVTWDPATPTWTEPTTTTPSTTPTTPTATDPSTAVPTPTEPASTTATTPTAAPSSSWSASPTEASTSAAP